MQIDSLVPMRNPSHKHCNGLLLQIFNHTKINNLPFFYQILEPRFNGDTLAMLLNIPPQKTLLRRHLTTNFNVLIGPEAQQEKREITESTAYTPLTTTAKVRVRTAFRFPLPCLTKKIRDKHGQGEVSSRRSVTFSLILDTKAFQLYLFKSASEISMQSLLLFLEGTLSKGI